MGIPLIAGIDEKPRALLTRCFSAASKGLVSYVEYPLQVVEAKTLTAALEKAKLIRDRAIELLTVCINAVKEKDASLASGNICFSAAVPGFRTISLSATVGVKLLAALTNWLSLAMVGRM